MTLRFADPSARADLGAFTARLVRLDPTASVRLRAGRGRVTAWAETPFETLATRSVEATLDAEVTVLGSVLLTALEVERSPEVDLGAGGAAWLGDLPPDEGWVRLEDIPAGELESLTDRGLALAREHGGPLGPPASLLDQTVLKVSGDVPGTVSIPMRTLFALSGMGFLGGADTGADGAGVVRVSATGRWLRLDARFGAVVRRRVMSLPLLT